MYLRNGNWVTEFYHEGVRYKKSMGQGISKTVAKEREAKFKTEVREGKHHQKSRKIKFKTFAEKYLEHARWNKKPSSAKRNQVSINMLMPWLKRDSLTSPILAVVAGKVTRPCTQFLIDGFFLVQRTSSLPKDRRIIGRGEGSKRGMSMDRKVQSSVSKTTMFY